jgi:hypothetical protein
MKYGIPFLRAQAGGEDLASHFALGFAPPPGLARERAGEVGVHANGEHGSLPCFAHCYTVLHLAGSANRGNAGGKTLLEETMHLLHNVPAA